MHLTEPGVLPASRRIQRLGLGVVLMVALGATLIRGQVDTGGVTGRINDPSGAVVVGAKVQLDNEATGARQISQSDSFGNYAFRSLPPGKYHLTVTQSGFQAYNVEAVPVVVAQTTTINIELQVGSSAISVDVQANPAVVETTSATLGTVVQEREIKDLPLNGRNFTQLLTLSAGVASTGINGSWGNPQVGNFVTPSVNGQSQKSTMWVLDGSNDSSPAFGIVSISPSVDDIAEFKTVSHADSAEYGGAMGGFVDVVTKSGTNDLHGTAFEFLRNNAFDARNFFLPSTSALRQNQFGGNLGGPVVIPKLYNGKDKTFFFVSYQGFRQSYANNNLYRVPTAAEMAGDLSNENPIFDPYSTLADPANPGSYLRTPFPGNQIPANRIDPIATTVVSTLYPKPINTGFAGTNGLNTRPNVTNQDLYSLRGDQRFGDKDTLSYRFSHVDSPVTTGGDGGGMAGTTFLRDGHGYNQSANYTHIFGPNAVFHFMFSRSLIDLDLSSKWDNADESTFVPQLYSTDFACGLIGGYGPKKCYVPFLAIPGFAGENEFQAGVGQTDIWEYKPDFSLVRGRHSMKMGFSYGTNRMWATTQRAFIGYDAFQTADLNNPGSTGSALASFLLGVPANAERADSPGSMTPGKIIGGFFQDQWKVNARLTINLGLRYDANILPNFGDPSFFPADYHVENQYSGNMDLLRGRYLLPKVPPSCASKGAAPCIPTPDGSLPAHVELAPNGRLFQNIYDNWQPRIGVAYVITPRTVFRAGYGRYFDAWSETVLASEQQEGLWPDVRRISNGLLNRNFVTATSYNPLALSGNLPAPNPFSLTTTGRDPYMKNAYSDQFNGGVQQQIDSSTVLTVNYVGSRGRRIPTGSIWNTAVVPGPGDPTLRQPYSYIAPASVIKDWSRNWYDSLQITLDRRFNNGFSYVLAYTWSKNLDLGASDGFGNTSPQDPYNLWLDKGPTDFGLPQTFSFASVYNLPFGRGNLQTNVKAVDYVIRDWQLNGIFQLTSGLPYSVFLCGDGANVGRGDCYLRPNLVGDPNAADQNVSQWLNRSAFEAPAQYTYGTLGRNSLRSQAFSNLDLSLFRNFRVRERLNIQFRAESFNLPNHTTFGIPNSNLSDNLNFGKIFSTRSIERQLQFALKILF